MLLQSAWLAGIAWAEKLPDELQRSVTTWFKEFSDLQMICVPRCLRLSDQRHTSSSEVHVFCDASTRSLWNCCLYAPQLRRSVNFRSLDFIPSKGCSSCCSKHRLELLAACLGCRLGNSISAVLSVPSNSIVFWSDSMNVLWWIRSQSRSFKPFIANRISEVHQLTEPAPWQYVSTAINPADTLSRGASVTELKKNHT